MDKLQEYKKRSVGERLEIIRTIIGMNQINFAKELGISQSAYNYYENDVRDIPISLLNTLYDKYEVNSLWVLREEGHPFSKSLPKEALEIIEIVETYLSDSSIVIELDKKIKIYRHIFTHYEKNARITKDEIYNMLDLAI